MKPCDWQLSLRNLSPEPPQTRYVHKAKPNPKPRNNRTKSVPVLKHMIPSEIMGDYKDANARRKSAPVKVPFKSYLLLNLYDPKPFLSDFFETMV